MSFLTRVVVFWFVVIAAISILRLFPRSLLARVLFAPQGPVPQRGEPRSRYMLRWAAYWESWVVQCVIVFAACWLVTSWLPALAESLWFLALWVAVVPALAAVASFACLVALVAWAKARIVGPDPVHAHVVDAGRAAPSPER
jgi:hypothetical protein